MSQQVVGFLWGLGDDDIRIQFHTMTAVQEHNLVPRRCNMLARVVARETFEFVRRMDDEFAPSPGDDDYLEACIDPALIDRNLEDPLDLQGMESSPQ